jgi:hypothetical protein
MLNLERPNEGRSRPGEVARRWSEAEVVVPLTGLEPVTPSLRMMCSTN